MDKIVEATIFRHWKTGSTGKPAEALRGSQTRNVKETTSRHIMMELLKTSDKEKILKAARGKRQEQR